MSSHPYLFPVVLLGLVCLVVIVLARKLFLSAKRKRDQTSASANSSGASASSSSSSTTVPPLRSAIKTGGDDLHSNPSSAASAEQSGRSELTQPETASNAEDQSESEEAEREPTAAQLIAEGDAHLAAFEYDDAIASYENADEAVTAEFGRESLEFAQLLISIEDAYLARDNEDDKDDLNCNHYLRALSILERCVGVYDTRLVPVLNRIAAFNLLCNKVNEADGLMRRCDLIERKARQSKDVTNLSAEQPTHVLLVTAANLSPRIGPDSGNEGVDVSVKAGDTAHAEYDYDTAVTNYTEALELAQAAFGRDSIKLVPILVRLGEAFHVRDILDTDTDGDNYTDPLDRTSLALSILVKSAGLRDLRLVPVLVNMVALNDQVGEHYKADRYLSMIDAIEAATNSASR